MHIHLLKDDLPSLSEPASYPSNPPWLCLPLNIKSKTTAHTTKHEILPRMLTQGALKSIFESQHSRMTVFTDGSSAIKLSSYEFPILSLWVTLVSPCPRNFVNRS